MWKNTYFAHELVHYRPFRHVFSTPAFNCSQSGWLSQKFCNTRSWLTHQREREVQRLQRTIELPSVGDRWRHGLHLTRDPCSLVQADGVLDLLSRPAQRCVCPTSRHTHAIVSGSEKAAVRSAPTDRQHHLRFTRLEKKNTHTAVSGVPLTRPHTSCLLFVVFFLSEPLEWRNSQGQNPRPADLVALALSSNLRSLNSCSMT